VEGEGMIGSTNKSDKDIITGKGWKEITIQRDDGKGK
jgi:hypothetical protein